MTHSACLAMYRTLTPNRRLEHTFRDARHGKKCVLLCTTPQLHKTHRPPRVIPPARPPSKHVPSLQLDSNHQQAVATSSLVYYSDTQTPEPCIRKGASTQALWKKWHANEYTPTWTSPSAPGATQNTSSRTWSPRPRCGSCKSVKPDLAT